MIHPQNIITFWQAIGYYPFFSFIALCPVRIYFFSDIKDEYGFLILMADFILSSLRTKQAT